MTIAKRAKALRKALDIVEARLRYNEALKDELARSTPEELRAFFYKYHPNYRKIIDESLNDAEKLSLNIELCKNALIVGIDEDLNTLQTLATVLNKYSEDEAYILSIAYLLHLHISLETREIDAARALNAERTKNFDRAARKADPKFVDKSEFSELCTYNDIMRIFEHAELFGLRENAFFGSYSTFIKTRDHKSIFFILSPQFERLLDKNSTAIATALKNLKTLSDFHHDLVADLEVKLNNATTILKLCQDFMAQENRNESAFPDQHRLMQSFNKGYNLKAELKHISEQIQRAITEDCEWKAEQEKQQRQREEQRRKQEKQEQQRLKLAAKQANINKEASAREAELKRQEAKLALEARLKIEQEEQQQRVEARLLANVRWKQEVEARKAEKELAKRSEVAQFAQAVTNNKTIYTDDRGMLQSTFQLPREIIDAHKDEIKELLSDACRSISYKKAVVLIKRLGGNVDVATGSSHQKIIFDGTVYQFIEEPGKFVAGLPRPHAGETELKRFELNLLKTVVRSVLPKEVRIDLEAENTQVKQTPKAFQ